MILFSSPGVYAWESESPPPFLAPLGAMLFDCARLWDSEKEISTLEVSAKSSSKSTSIYERNQSELSL
jgi:hypothetical protein